jgi:hypothetical protein
MDVGGARHACTTDADGVAKIQAPQADAARVELTDLPALRELLRPRWEQVRAGDWLTERIDHTSRHFALDLPQVPVAVPCTLRADFHGEDRFAHVVFEDVDVGVETECGEGGLCREDPPPATPPAPSDAPAPVGDEDVAEFPIL